MLVSLGRLALVSFALIVTDSLSAQSGVGRALAHDDYDSWQSIRGRAVSKDGRWMAYTVARQVGDGELVVRDVANGTEYRQPRGTGARFSADGAYVVFTIEVPREEKLAYDRSKLKSKKDKKKKAGDKGKKDERKEPKKTHGVLRLADGSVEVIEKVQRWSLTDEDGSFLVYHLEKPKKDKKKKDGGDAEKGEGEAKSAEAEKKAEKKTEPEKPAESKKQAEGEKETKKADDEPENDRHVDGSALVVRNFADGSEKRIEGVTSFGLTDKKAWLWFVQNSKKDDDKIVRGLHAMHLPSGSTKQLVAGAAKFSRITTDREVTRMAFVSDLRDVEADQPTFDLYAWDFRADQAKRVVSHADAKSGLPVGHCVSDKGSLSFSRDGGVLMFGAAELPRDELPPILADEKVVVDVWNWRDPLLQPMQKQRASQTRNESVACVWRFGEDRLVVVGRAGHEGVRLLTDDGSRALVSDSMPYAQEVSWDGRYSDMYVVNTIDGTRRQIAEHVAPTSWRGGGATSPQGRFVLYFADHHWHSIDVETGHDRNLTAGLDVHFEQEDWDRPSAKGAHGIAGWTRDDAAVLIYDQFDLWRFAPDGGDDPVCVTDGWGRANDVRLRWIDLDPEERYVPDDAAILLSAFDKKTMASGFYEDRVRGLVPPKKLLMDDASLRFVGKAEDADVLLVTRSTFRESPDVWTTDRQFSGLTKQTALNPQQKDFRWGTAETVRWKSLDGAELTGYLIKPDGFDPTKKYPMMVYFYERMSERVHSYSSPAPGTSPNAAYYVSNGYLWFVPDIYYRIGYPGESALDCIVPGVQSIVAKGFVDENAIGAAGHSWGGYQTAYLVTKTDIFAAVESGAPVSNMTSAYGGIRWSSGMSRAFQYEKTQSRIGGTLWQYPMRYLENSPLFAADRVSTPVLMLHNDEDGAVPWYQGIEYFCALRRLGKEVYMLNYNGAGHGLRKRQNQMDWTMRMAQYFDHHLRGAPMPKWMSGGVPYVDREREKFEFRPPETVRVMEAATEQAESEPEEAATNGGNG